MFLGVRGFEYAAELGSGHVPSSSNFLAVYYLITSVHAIHVLGGVILNLGMAAFGLQRLAGGAGAPIEWLAAAARYWHFVTLVGLCLFVALYLL
jgi:heme/copper-type cytochrome/quinol oxidase subunit 3